MNSAIVLVSPFCYAFSTFYVKVLIRFSTSSILIAVLALDAALIGAGFYTWMVLVIYGVGVYLSVVMFLGFSLSFWSKFFVTGKVFIIFADFGLF